MLSDLAVLAGGAMSLFLVENTDPDSYTTYLSHNKNKHRPTYVTK